MHLLPALLLTACGTQAGDDTAEDIHASRDTDVGCKDACDTPSSAVAAQTLSELSYDRSRTADNALKGFLTSYLWGEPSSELPDQLEFLYLPMKELWDETGATLETGLEPHLAAAASREHHGIIRVYIDYPSQESGLPDHLADTVPCQTYDDYGGGCSPDYANEDLLEAMTGLIEAMGAVYDGDQRLGFVQIGLLGFWGEWHTYPYTDWFPDEGVQDTILAAFEAAFPTTHLQVRRPAASSLERRIGFHDDSFAYSTIGETSWFFWTELEAEGGGDRWQEVPIGGELRPELQDEIFRDDYELGEYAQDLDECIDQTHASYLLNYTGFSGDGTGYVGEELERAREAALRMGYEFHLASATLTASGLLDGEVDVVLSLDIAQTGVAPFYYPLDLVLSSAHLEASVWAGEDLSTLLPGESRTVTVDLGRVPVGQLSDSIALSLSSTMLQDSQAVRFATESPVTTTGDLELAWNFTCDPDGVSVNVGTVVGTTDQGCDCLCDVDRQIRACDGTSCD
jgi:hypothetical protein